MVEAAILRIRRIEVGTVAVMAAGFAMAIIRGNLYSYDFNLFTVPVINFTFRILNLSLLSYSALGLVVFSALHVYDERDPKRRWRMYMQGWLLLLIAASGYEWLYSAIDQGANITLNNMAVNQNPYTWLAKRASVIFFGALFLFWLLEKRMSPVYTVCSEC
jgi:hypothetical protein